MFEALCDEGKQTESYKKLCIYYMFEALCDEGTICLKPYVMKVNKQKVIKNLFQPKKKTENTWKCPNPTNRVPIFNCSCF